MKPSRMHLLLLITCLFVIAMPALAQTNPSPLTAAAAGGPRTSLPDAPSAQRRTTSSPPAALGPVEAQDRHFILVNSLMFTSSIATAELATRCFNSGACTAVPGPMRSRGALYGVGLSADIGATVLGYYLKRSGHRWWFVPAALVTAGNVIYGVHAARHIR